MRRYLFLGTGFMLIAYILGACNGNSKERSMQKQMTRAEMLMEIKPDSSFCILNNLYVDMKDMPTPMKMEYSLLMANAQNRTDREFMPIDSFMPVVSFFEREEPSQYLLALYLMGRMYHKEKDCPLAMEYYLTQILPPFQLRELVIPVHFSMNRLMVSGRMQIIT